MTKLMRKHGKVILAVVGSLLMIVFILPNLGGGGSNPANFVLGHLNGKAVTNANVQGSKNDLTVLRNFTIGIPVRGGTLPLSLLQYLITGRSYFPDQGGPPYVPGLEPHLPLTLDPDLQPIHWYLLLQEAQHYGIMASEGEITQVVALMHLTDKEMEAELSSIGIGQGTLRHAIGDALILRKYAELVRNSTQISLPELEYHASVYLTTIQINYATLDGTRDWQKAPEPSEDAIKKQFDAYKDVLATPMNLAAADAQAATPPAPPLIDGHHYPFGYKLPDRVQIQYLLFDKSALAAKFAPTSADYDAAFAYYTSHPDEFKNPADTAKMVVSTQPATKPFEEVQKELVARQVDARVSKTLKAAADRAHALATDAWKNVESKGGYREQIPAKSWLDYQKIQAGIAANPDYVGYQPAIATTGWLGAAEIAKAPDIGEAFLTTPGGPVSLATLATHVKDLVGTANKDALGRYFLEVGPEGPLLTDERGDYFVYRVIAAEKSHTPASLADVRPQVVEDLKKLSVYQAKQTEARTIAKLAQSGDLLGIARSRNIPAGSSDKLKQGMREIKGLGEVPGLIDAAFALTKDPAATQPVQKDPAGTQPDRRISATTTYADDATLKVYAIELGNYTPASPAEFAAQRPEMARAFLDDSRDRFAATWLSLPAVSQREHYVSDSKKSDAGSE